MDYLDLRFSKNPKILVMPHPYKGIYRRKKPPTGQRRWVRSRYRNGAWTAPNYRKNVQSLGSGRTNRWIDLSYVATQDSGIVSLSTALSTSLEFAYLATQYRYVRLNKLSLSIAPQQNNLITRWLMKWTDDGGNLAIDTDDSTKIVQTHTTKYQFLKWKPINATLPTNKAGGLVTTNLTSWMVIDDLYANSTYYVPGTILYTISNLTENVQLNFRLSIYMSFCGSKIPTSAKLTRIQELVKSKEKSKAYTFQELKPED
jgi:hypothetical protein